MSRVYATRVNHIKALNTVLSAREDFKSLELFRHNATGEEYLFTGKYRTALRDHLPR